jgi:hypothetical protein
MRMGHGRLLRVILGAMLWAALATAAGAQPADLRPILDPGGRFSISFPADWEIRTSPSGRPAVVGTAPAQDDGVRTSVNVVVDTLSAPSLPEDLAQAAEPMQRTIFREYTIVQEGPATIGGRPAYYRYYTWRTNTGVSLYQVQVYFAVGRNAFVVTGSTLNDAERIQTDLPVIARIIETFKPIQPSSDTSPDRSNPGAATTAP